MGRRSGVILGFGAAFAAALGVWAPVASAAPSCGDTLTTSVVLANDLTCSASLPAALVIGAKSVTVDLNGHTIHGGRIGVSDTSFSGVGVKNGTIDSQTGIKLRNVTNARINTVTFIGGSNRVGVLSSGGTTNQFTHLTMDLGLNLVSLSGEKGDRTTGGNASDMSRSYLDLNGLNDTFASNVSTYEGTAGFWCDHCTNVAFTSNHDTDGFTGFVDKQAQARDTYTSNVVTAALEGFDLEDGAVTVAGNTVNGTCCGVGIAVANAFSYDDNGSLLAPIIQNNVVKNTGDVGIYVFDSLGAVVSGNTVSKAGWDGIVVVNSDEADGPSTIANNTVLSSYRDGIAVLLPPGYSSGNVARNSGSTDCIGVTCPAPQSTAPPVVSGTNTVGQKLSTTAGSWTISSAGKAYSFQWFRCDADGSNCNAIAGATSRTYKLTWDDNGSTLSTQVTGTDDNGSTTSSLSAPSAAIGWDPPASATAPTISGTPTDGATWVGTKGTWTGSPATSYGYQWYSCAPDGSSCNPIPGATSIKYVTTTADLGGSIRLDVVASNPFAANDAYSDPSPEIMPSGPTNVNLPTISGTPNAGYTLTAHVGKWKGTPTIGYTYQWNQCNPDCNTLVPMSGATASTYRLHDSDVGYQYVVTVTATNPYGVNSATSAATSAIGAGVTPSNTVSPTIVGDAVDGSTVQALPGTWTGSTPMTFTYVWYSCPIGANCVAIPGATHSTYTVQQSDVGNTLTINVFAHNAYGQAVAGNGSSVIQASPPVNTYPPTVSLNPGDGQMYTADNGAWDGLTPMTFSYQWLVCPTQDPSSCIGIPGEVGSATALFFPGIFISVQVTAHNADGDATETAQPIPADGDLPVPG